VAPYYFLAAIAAVVGGVDRAFEIADFVLPPIAFVLVYLLLLDLTGRKMLAVAGSVTVLLVPFGPRNLLSPILQFVNYDRNGLTQPLEYSRIIHPEVSFTLLALCLLLLWRTLRTERAGVAIATGLCGALLFYTYIYYWPVWLGTCLILLIVYRQARRTLWLVNLSTWIGSLPFWWLFAQSTEHPNFANVVTRHTSEVGHLPTPAKVIYSIVCTLVFLACVGVYVRLRAATSVTRRLVVLFFSAIFLASIAALNMEVLTGFNVESMLHFPNRLFQPLLTLVAFTLCGGILGLFRYDNVILLTGAGVLVLLGATRQVMVSYAVADAHEYTPQHHLVFDWLNANTRLDDVVLASAKDMNDLIPVFTQDRVFVPNGERTSASNDEIGWRFVIAMKLLGHDESEIRALMAQDVTHGEPPIGLTYTYFLFLGTENWRLTDTEIDRLLQQYRGLDLGKALGRWRIDYVYGRGSERPGSVPGWRFTETYADPYGSVWRLEQAAAESS
jgi:hypothetical protein